MLLLLGLSLLEGVETEGALHQHPRARLGLEALLSILGSLGLKLALGRRRLGIACSAPEPGEAPTSARDASGTTAALDTTNAGDTPTLAGNASLAGDATLTGNSAHSRDAAPGLQTLSRQVGQLSIGTPLSLLVASSLGSAGFGCTTGWGSTALAAAGLTTALLAATLLTTLLGGLRSLGLLAVLQIFDLLFQIFNLIFDLLVVFVVLLLGVFRLLCVVSLLGVLGFSRGFKLFFGSLLSFGRLFLYRLLLGRFGLRFGRGRFLGLTTFNRV